MSGDLERGEDGARPPDDRPAVERSDAERSDADRSSTEHPGPEPGRPDFLPPSGGHPRLGQALVPPVQPLVPPIASPAPRPPLWAGALWNVGVLVAAGLLLVSAFLPWVRALVTLSAFGQTMTRDLGSATGLDSDGMVAAIPVLALAALGMAFWGLIVDDPRVSSFTAVPGGMALVTSGVFLLRLDETRDQLVGIDTPFGYEITPAYGWYLAVAASLLVLGFGLARPVVARVTTPAPSPQPPALPQPPQPQWHEPAHPAVHENPPDAEPDEPADDSKPSKSEKTEKPDKPDRPGKSATWSPP